MMRNVLLSFATLAALAVTASEADARWFRSYRSPSNYYSTPRIVYPGASYYGYSPGYSGYYRGYSGFYPSHYGSYYYQPRGLSISWSQGFGPGVGYYSGYRGYGSIYSPWYGSNYYRGWRW